MASTSRPNLSTLSHNSIPGGNQKKRRLSVSSDTSSDEEDNKTIASKSNLRSPLRRAVSVPAISTVKPEEQPKPPKDKKKRRKKKRKVSVVQGPNSPEKPLPQISNVARRRTSISSTTFTVPSYSGPIAGPSTVHSLSSGSTASSATLASSCDMSDRQPVAGPSTAPSHAPQSENGNASATASPVVLSTTTPDKGKGKAIEVAEPTSVSTQSATPTELPVHQAMLSSLLPTLTCRVCLFLMNRPFALAPCGHVACHGCLVNWFSQSDPSAPLDLPPIPTIYRRKTCPHCRAVVRERPVEVWALKETIDAIIKSGLVDADLIPEQANEANAPGGDVWKDIFPPIPTFRNHDHDHGLVNVHDRSLLGVEDLEDGGVYRCIDCMHEIWEGVCSGCHREYPAHRARFADSESDEDDLNLGTAFANILGRIGRGEYLDDGESISSDEEGFDHAPLWLDDDIILSDGAESYEGSFIDDGDEEAHGGDHSEVEVLEGPPEVPRFGIHGIHIPDLFLPSDDEDDIGIHPPVLPPPPPRRADPIIISSDEEDEEDDIRSRGQTSRGTRSVGRVVFSEDEDDSDDEGVGEVDEVPYAEPERLRWPEEDDDIIADDPRDDEGSEDVDGANWSLQHQYSDDEDQVDFYSGDEGYDLEDDYF